jgi:hypothetical protein
MKRSDGSFDTVAPEILLEKFLVLVISCQEPPPRNPLGWRDA